MIYIILLLIVQIAFAEVDFGAELDKMKNGPDAFACYDFPPPSSSKSKYAFTKGYSAKGANCKLFVKDNGELGEHGKILVNHLPNIKNSKLFDNNLGRMNEVCPKWSKFSKIDKEYFWVWFFASIALAESTCRNNYKSKAVNGMGIGYFQLDAPKSARSWKGGKDNKACRVASIVGAKENITCALEIFNEQLRGKASEFKGNGNLFDKKTNSYWQKLRYSDGDEIIERVKTFPGCK